MMKRNLKDIVGILLAMCLLLTTGCALADAYESNTVTLNGMIRFEPKTPAEPAESGDPEPIEDSESIEDSEMAESLETVEKPELVEALEIIETPEEIETAEAIEEPEEVGELEDVEEPLPVCIIYERNEEGTLVLDGRGDPIIAFLPEGFEKPLAYERDENGALVLNENGDPVPLYAVPEETVEILLNPDRYVEMYPVTPSDEIFLGSEVTLAANVVGYENCEVALRWQYSVDDVEWHDVEGATSDRFAVTVTEENHLYYWRVTVSIIRVIEPFATERVKAAEMVGSAAE